MELVRYSAHGSSPRLDTLVDNRYNINALGLIG